MRVGKEYAGFLTMPSHTAVGVVSSSGLLTGSIIAGM